MNPAENLSKTVDSFSQRVASNPSYQQAMYAGALDSFVDVVARISTGAEPWN
jgi:hypothetical protein